MIRKSRLRLGSAVYIHITALCSGVGSPRTSNEISFSFSAAT